MSMPAGWYDDGSGRQRWWDGQKWTDQFAAGGSAPQTPPHFPNGPHATATSGRVSPVLGFVGLGLALVGTVLACIPVTLVMGVVVLVAAFVVSLVGLFRKNAAKWPSIVGLILAIVGGAIGTVVSLVIVASTLTGPVGPIDSTSVPTPSASPETSTPSTDGARPTPEEIAQQTKATFTADGITNYDDMPDFYPCMGEQLYASDLSDETLKLVISGADPVEAERDAAEQAIGDAILACDPNGEGAF